MLNSLDLLILIFATTLIPGLFSVIMTFTLKSHSAKKLFLFIVAAVSLFVTYGGISTFWPYFAVRTLISIVIGLATIASVVLASISKYNNKLFLIARIAASISVILGILNTFIIWNCKMNKIEKDTFWCPFVYNSRMI